MANKNNNKSKSQGSKLRPNEGVFEMLVTAEGDVRYVTQGFVHTGGSLINHTAEGETVVRKGVAFSEPYKFQKKHKLPLGGEDVMRSASEVKTLMEGAAGEELRWVVAFIGCDPMSGVRSARVYTRNEHGQLTWDADLPQLSISPVAIPRETKEGELPRLCGWHLELFKAVQFLTRVSLDHSTLASVNNTAATQELYEDIIASRRQRSGNGNMKKQYGAMSRTAQDKFRASLSPAQSKALDAVLA